MKSRPVEIPEWLPRLLDAIVPPEAPLEVLSEGHGFTAGPVCRP